MLSLCTKNLTLGIYSRLNSLFVGLDEKQQRITGIIGRYYERLLSTDQTTTTTIKQQR